MIDVCCAIILDRNKILAVQRGQESLHPLQWEFPGGKMRSDETAIECIIREIEEELTVRIEIINEIESVEYDYGLKQIRLIPFICITHGMQFKLTEHVALKWFEISEWDSLNWSAADRELIIKNYSKLFSILGAQ